MRRQLHLSAELNNRFQSVVAYGPFKGLVLPAELWWGATDRAAMLTGMYEQEVLSTLEQMKSGRDILINAGAADGYYGVGVLVSGMFSRSYCYEMSDRGRDAIAVAAERNGVSERVTIRGRCDTNFLDDFSEDTLDRAVVLMDIEGGEFDLLQDKQLEKLRRTALIVEVHERLVPDGEQRLEHLKQRARRWFTVTEFRTGTRNPGTIPELCSLSDTDRWLLTSESRPYLMTWLRLQPHQVELSSDL